MLAGKNRAGDRSCCRLLVGALVLGTSSLAQAQQRPDGRADRVDAEPIRIDYKAAPSCPPAEQFVAQVLGRAQRARLANASEPARTFVIVIERRSGGGFSGSVAIREGEQLTVARSVDGRQCDAVAGALALSTALAVDPTAPTDPSAGQEASESAKSEKPGQQDQQSANSTPSTPPRPSPDEGDSSGAPIVYGSTPWSYRLSLGPLLRTGNSPAVALGGAIGIEAETPDSVSGLGVLGVEVAVLRSLNHSSARGATSHLELLLARPSLCGRLPRWGAFTISPCVVAELGAIQGEGADLPRPATARRWWAAFEVPLRAEFAVSERFLVGASLGVLLPATRYTFVFENPETAIYRVPAVGFSSALRLVVRL